MIMPKKKFYIYISTLHKKTCGPLEPVSNTNMFVFFSYLKYGLHRFSDENNFVIICYEIVMIFF